MRYDYSQFGDVAFYVVCFVIAIIMSIISSSKRNKDVDYWEKKSKLGTIILTLIFGRLGIHRFYLNRKVSGTIQLLGFLSIFMLASLPDSLTNVATFYFGVTAVWSIIDIFLVLFDGLVPNIAPSSNINNDQMENEEITDDSDITIDCATPLNYLEDSISSISEDNSITEESTNNDLEEVIIHKEANKEKSVSSIEEVTQPITSGNDEEKTSSKNLNLIRELSILHKEGILTDEEFKKKKEEVLSRL